MLINVQAQDAFFYQTQNQNQSQTQTQTQQSYDPQHLTVFRGEIRVGQRYQADICAEKLPLLKDGKEGNV